MNNFNYIDLFAGIGGFHQAMRNLGGKCVLASEIDESAIRKLRIWGCDVVEELKLIEQAINKAEQKKLENPTFYVEKSFFAYYNICAGMHRRRNMS